MKFSETYYNKIWSSSEGGNILSVILNNPELIRANHTFWTTKFKIDPQICPTNAEGEAMFKSKMRQLDGGVLMDMRAPLGDSVPEDTKGEVFYTGSIPEFISRGTVEKATERAYREKLFSQLGGTQDKLLFEYATNVLQSKIDGANQTLSHMSAQLLSTGKIIYKQGEGVQGGLLKAEIPAENFTNAGKVVWTDNTKCRILDQMVQIESDFQEKWGTNMAMQWEVTRDVFMKCFVPNAQVIEWVRYNKTINNTPLPEKSVINFEMAKEAIATFEGLSPIVIVEEKQKDVNNGMVHGWADNTAVLRPAGYAGLIRHTTMEDQELLDKYGNSVNSYSFAPALSGLATVRNSVVVNGNFKEWHTDLIMAAVPSLDEFLYHVIVNIAQAAE